MAELGWEADLSHADLRKKMEISRFRVPTHGEHMEGRVGRLSQKEL